MNFYSDENFPQQAVEELRNLGHDGLTAFEDGKANQSLPDEAVLERATKLERTVLTHNRLDFKRLHQRNNKHFGIVICTENKDRFELAKLIDEKTGKLEIIKGELVRGYRPS